jgi:putative ATPase
VTQQSLLSDGNGYQPLAEVLRPQRIADVVGQSHLLAQGKPLQLAIAAGKPHSMIFWGPPGVGKTTLAKLLAREFDFHFIALSAVLAGVKEIRAALDQAVTLRAQSRSTLLFVDEIHRFNKSQQDGLLGAVEEGLVVLIGATTENPSFEVNSALLSRSQVYVLQTLSAAELATLVDRALMHYQMAALTDPARAMLIALADGDARRLLNSVEQVIVAAKAKQLTTIDVPLVQQSLGSQTRRFDKGGDHFYDQISALHKSVRGSDPDAALYWLTRMLDAGADARYLARRIVRMAWEDIGLADPRGIQLANDAATTYERLGSPEGDLALAQAVIYLSVAAKSNAGYKAYNAARAFVRTDNSRPVPMHLRNAPTALMKDLGAGKGYRYAHDEAHGYAAGEQYLPDGMPPPGWYQPTQQGLEAKITEKLQFLRVLDRQQTSGASDHKDE